ncbi:MAG: TIGR02391 family protein [Dehalococcoidia bacterium]|nr:TIGR02391 family protein [Dehalococcoidia bacterium]
MRPLTPIGGFLALNNRVRKLSDLTEDGQSLMNKAVGRDPVLKMSALKSDTERNEHEGLRFMLAGSMSALRNPSTHDDNWTWDKDMNRCLESLGLASLLHYYLDRCEEYRASTNSTELKSPEAPRLSQ